MSNIEQTLSIIKPDAVERNLQDQIKNDFKKKGFEIIKEKKINLGKIKYDDKILHRSKVLKFYLDKNHSSEKTQKDFKYNCWGQYNICLW